MKKKMRPSFRIMRRLNVKISKVKFTFDKRPIRWLFGIKKTPMDKFMDAFELLISNVFMSGWSRWRHYENDDMIKIINSDNTIRYSTKKPFTLWASVSFLNGEAVSIRISLFPPGETSLVIVELLDDNEMDIVPEGVAKVATQINERLEKLPSFHRGKFVSLFQQRIRNYKANA